uniref:Uncharacterized protein n=1 Tax=Rhipicephalus zambeziensis TaxID=60191 RepID=A0A224Y7Q7_9ACAR
MASLFRKANEIPARLRPCGGHPRRPPSSCPPTHHLVRACDGAPSSRDKRHPGWLLRVFCPSVFRFLCRRTMHVRPATDLYYYAFLSAVLENERKEELKGGNSIHILPR